MIVNSWSRSATTRLENRRDFSAKIQQKSCCTKFSLLHILLHKMQPDPPKSSHLDVVLCSVSC